MGIELIEHCRADENECRAPPAPVARTRPWRRAPINGLRPVYRVAIRMVTGISSDQRWRGDRGVRRRLCEQVSESPQRARRVVLTLPGQSALIEANAKDPHSHGQSIPRTGHRQRGPREVETSVNASSQCPTGTSCPPNWANESLISVAWRAVGSWAGPPRRRLWATAPAPRRIAARQLPRARSASTYSRAGWSAKGSRLMRVPGQ